jgi:NADH:ubiquinone reductase (H+-translocating)
MAIEVSDPKIVIVGGGMGGLAAARALRKTPARVIVIDRTNHNLFQPLLYQVATSELTAGQIAAPIRAILRKQRNTTTILGEVTGVDTARRCVFVSDVDRKDVPVRYDFLVLATGARGSYFGHDEFAPHAPGIKTLADAVSIRSRILEAFERAEGEEEPERHGDLLTFVLVGAGPAGVEMAGALAILVRHTLRSEFRRIDPTSARIVLVDAGPRVLAMMGPEVSKAAKKRLERLGVEVRLGHRVEHVDEGGVIVAGERIESRTVIWTAGVEPSPAGKWLGAATDRAGRVIVRPDLTVAGQVDTFVIGDTASCDRDGQPLPGVAQVALQQGRYVGKLIDARLRGKRVRRPFRYFDKGNMAIVGQGYAVIQTKKHHLVGFLAFLVWAFIHLVYLAQGSQRLTIVAQWAWTVITRQRGSRLIVEHHPPRLAAAGALNVKDAADVAKLQATASSLTRLEGGGHEARP